MLAYHLLTVIEKSFLDEGIHTSWLTIREQLSTHQVVTVVLPMVSGKSKSKTRDPFGTRSGILRIRKGTTPDPEHGTCVPHRKIYKTLRIPVQVMKPVKTWHEPTGESD